MRDFCKLFDNKIDLVPFSPECIRRDGVLMSLVDFLVELSLYSMTHAPTISFMQENLQLFHLFASLRDPDASTSFTAFETTAINIKVDQLLTRK